MYEKKNRGWLKHLDFMLVDIACLQLAFAAAYMVRFGINNPYRDADYQSLCILYLLIDFCVAVIFDSYKNILKRSPYRECRAVVKHVFLVEGLTLFCLFSTQRGDIYSRIFFYVMVPLYISATFLGRSLWKKWLRKEKSQGFAKSLLIIAPRKKLEECIENVRNTGNGFCRIAGAVATDESLKGRSIRDVPVVADYDEVIAYICREWVDEVFLFMDFIKGYPSELIEDLNRMGVVTHLAVARAGDADGNKQQVERFGNYVVLTTGLNYATATQLFCKRMMDILGGLAGCLITLVLTVLIGPVICFCSPGPVFFSQIRVGRNGKKFKMYKFRTMYPDAEERKKELLDRNRISGGMMFKLDYDPRIIGNRKKEDGTVRKGIGSLLRRTSLDELPQMLNILKGDMSLVGTRPPTVDEWERYELHHRARLAFRPGLTGLWQISGRSDITDFEEVVRLDTKYINEWSIWLDVKILLKTVGVVIRSKGAL